MNHHQNSTCEIVDRGWHQKAKKENCLDPRTPYSLRDTAKAGT
ncbi:hypothetical protein HMPREF0293_0098 [Corynebacterium glucuronolyticum ATCC 51866]|uniref:Uncharacterized protein n=1 Tax=Corynebacterium glucuronolyticum ATCC 51866 TaxID=548478 RepID=A0ABM9XTA5_9CORY|nr:hypothetical protein HMPREF0293_0098 [Corynebacterium glucuronolyticum ATCC 51866]